MHGMSPTRRRGARCWPAVPVASIALATICSTLSVRTHHTKLGTGDLEVIDIIEAMGWCADFCRGNVLKYLLRAGKKEGASALVDLRKAQWHLDRAIAKLEEQ